MLNLSSINSLTEFQKNARVFTEQLAKSKQPLVLTVNGKARLVVQDSEAYQSLLEDAEKVRFIAAIQAGLDDAAAGRFRPAEDVFADIETEYGF